MILALDIHGVIDKNPEAFRTLAEMYRYNKSTEIYVITGPQAHVARKELCELGFCPLVHYDKLISVVDWLIENDIPTSCDENGHYWTEAQYWWSSKGKICIEYGIDVLIDDKIEYKENAPEEMKTDFFLFDGKEIRQIE